MALDSERYEFDGYTLDVAKRQLRKGNELVRITRREFELLTYLLEYHVQNERRPIPREKICEKFWPGILFESADQSLRELCGRVRRNAFQDTGPNLHRHISTESAGYVRLG